MQILQNEGNGVAAAINAASLALVDAGIPMRDMVAACSSGMRSIPEDADTIVFCFADNKEMIVSDAVDDLSLIFRIM